MYLKCKFSGVPQKNEYKWRLKKLNCAVFIWTFARLLRAVSSLWDTKALIGMMIELQDKRHELHENASKAHSSDESQNLIIPMMVIVCYVIVEIVPIWTVLDGNFIDIFLKFDVLIEQKDLIAPLLMPDGHLIQSLNNSQAASQILYHTH